MKADIRWLDDPQVFRVNRLDAHSDHKFYENKEDYKKQNQRLKQSLNGIWKFHYSVNALERPADFYQKWFNCKNFDEMKEFEEAWSLVDENFVYRKGQWVEVKDFNEDRWMDSTTGIHFWMNRNEALGY